MGLREEPNSIYGDRAVSSIDFYAGNAGVAIITGFYFPHGLTDQCQEAGITSLKDLMSLSTEQLMNLGIRQK
ncbi:MAG: hypothetical protein RLZZ435_2321 [Cyanobacteriota bacterium]|jgi:hypothetical protein